MKTNPEERLRALTEAYDVPLWGTGVLFAGIDEAGRGPLCGNVVAGCVALPPEPLILGVDDSKKLSAKRREELYDRIRETALFWGVGEATPEEIDEMNILEATKLAMRRAAEKVPAEVFLIDAVKQVGLKGAERPIIHGDAVSYAIAAASILAKVTRDRFMRRLAEEYPQYGFEDHKGYGTKAHYEAIRKYGVTPYHRLTFLKDLGGK